MEIYEDINIYYEFEPANHAYYKFESDNPSCYEFESEEHNHMAALVPICSGCGQKKVSSQKYNSPNTNFFKRIETEIEWNGNLYLQLNKHLYLITTIDDISIHSSFQTAVN